MPQNNVELGWSKWSPDNALELIGFGPLHWLLFLGTGIVWAADACAVMLLSFVGPSARCEWQLDSWQESLLGSAVFAGQLAGASAWGAVGDTYGRRPAILWSSALTAACGVGSALAPSYAWLLAARTLSGFTLAAAPVAFTWMMEWTTPRLRGHVMVLFSVWWTLGTMAEACLAWLLLNNLGWRLLVAASAVPQLLFILMYPWLPESPHLLMAQAVAARAAVDGNGSKAGGAAAGDAAAAEAKAAGYEGEARRVLQRAAKAAGVSLPSGGRLVPDAADERIEDQVEEEEDSSNTSAVMAGSASREALGAGHKADEQAASAGMVVSADASSSAAITGSAPKQRRPASSQQLAQPPRAVTPEQEPLMLHQQVGGGSNRCSGSGAAAAAGHKHGRPRHPLLRPAMFTLMFVWFVSACAYYGIVMLAAELRMPSHGGSTNAPPPPDTAPAPALAARMTMQQGVDQAGITAGQQQAHLLQDQGAAAEGGDSGGDCTGPGGALSLPSSTFIGVIASAASEIPAMMYSVMVVGAGVNHAHRAAAVSLTLAGTAAALLMDVGLRAHGQLAGGWASWLDTVALLASRCLICATYNLVYIYTPELMSTKVRALGMGICNTVSRFGGLAAPLLAVGLVERGQEQLSLATLGALCTGAALVMWAAPPHRTLAPHSHVAHGV